MIKKLEQIKKENELLIGFYGKEFLNEDCGDYIDDAIAQFADNNTSIYYSDQRNFYNENTDVCLEAIDELCIDLNEWLKQGLDLEQMICKAGALGEYRQIENSLREDLEYILVVYAVNQAISMLCTGAKFDALEFVEEVQGNAFVSYYTRFSEIDDLLDEYVENASEDEE